MFPDKLTPEVTALSEHKDRGIPYDAAPTTNPYFGQPEDAFELINKYGTYNIQPTNEQENAFPMIAQGLPTQWRDLRVEKTELEKE